MTVLVVSVYKKGTATFLVLSNYDNLGKCHSRIDTIVYVVPVYRLSMRGRLGQTPDMGVFPGSFRYLLSE